MADLFGILNVAKSGMSAQQTAISISSHNISNANTAGYSRQIATLETSRPYSTTPGQIGTGVQVSSIQRVRDAFLDYQIRSQTSIQGKYTARDSYLSQVESIFNEPSDTGLSTLIGNFFSSWTELSKQPQGSDARTVVAQQSQTLANSLNQSYNQFQDLKTSAQSQIKDTVFQINNELTQVDNLNKQIVSVNITGQSPNDLMDQRDLLIDNLSNEFGIKIDKANFDGEDVTPTDTSPLNTGVDAALVKTQDNANVKRFSYVNDIQPPTFTAGQSYTISYYKNGDATSKPETVIYKNIDQATFNQLNEGRVIWGDSKGNAIATDGTTIADGATIDFAPASGTPTKLATFQPTNGELNGYASVQQDIQSYTDQLNNVAKALAFAVNAVESGVADTTTGVTAGPPATFPTSTTGTQQTYDSMPFFVNSTAAVTGNAADDLANTLLAEQNITAGNIAVNSQIINNVMNIKTRTNDNLYANESDNTKDGSTDGARALAIAQLQNSILNVQDIGTTVNSRADLFTKANENSLGADTMTINNTGNGTTIDSYFKDTVDKLAVQEQEAKSMVTNQQKMLASYQQNKQSVSGVSIDEEMSNLILFQHAYQAGAKVISTIDQLLDVVINGLIK